MTTNIIFKWYHLCNLKNVKNTNDTNTIFRMNNNHAAVYIDEKRGK